MASVTGGVTGKIIQAIADKLLPWHRIQWNSAGVDQWQSKVCITILGIPMAIGITKDSKFQVKYDGTAGTVGEKLVEFHVRRIEALLNGATRDDAGNLQTTTQLPAIPDGWRELEQGETRQKTDMFLWNGAWSGYLGFDPTHSVCAKYDQRIHAKHIRKIEKPNEPQYREPTNADLANGPIEVEICDVSDQDGLWRTRKLYAVLPKICPYPFAVATEHDASSVACYRHARIKIEAAK